MARYTKIPTDTFEELQINAGFLTTSFDPATGVAAPAFATTGGVTFSENPEYADFGEGVDNCPPNTKELKRKISVSPTITGTALTINKDVAAMFIGACNVDSRNSAYDLIKPTLDIDAENDFNDLWQIGDYSQFNGETKGGSIAIHLLNAFNTAGFSWQTTDKGKGQFAFTFTGHTSITDQTTLPYEFYIVHGAAETATTTTPPANPTNNPS